MRQFSGICVDGLLVSAIEEAQKKLSEKVGEKAANDIIREVWQRFGSKPEEVLKLLVGYYNGE